MFYLSTHDVSSNIYLLLTLSAYADENAKFPLQNYIDDDKISAVNCYKEYPLIFKSRNFYTYPLKNEYKRQFWFIKRLKDMHIQIEFA